MRGGWRDANHLIRLAGVIVLFVVAFLVARQAVIPKAFGMYGHYRPGALDDVRKHPTRFAGQAECLYCHEEQAKAKASGRHGKVNCEACHGPAASHAADPAAGKPKIADVPGLCQNCHEKDAAKPAAFPQVARREHYGGTSPCEGCHQPHSPKLQ